VCAADDPGFLNQGVRGLAGTLGESVVDLHRQAERLSERLDRLHTTGERTRDDPSHLELVKECDEFGSLAAPMRVQGPEPVVSVPIVALAGRRVTDDNTRHVETIRLAEKLRELLPCLLGFLLDAGRVCARGLEKELLPPLGVDLP